MSDTHRDICTRIEDQVLDAVTGPGNQGFIMDSMVMDATGCHAELYCRNVKLMLRQTSVMILQNRTLGATAGDDQSTDVTNNPIVGRSWDVKGNTIVSRNNFLVTGAAKAGGINLPYDGHATYAGSTGPLMESLKVAGPTDVKYALSTRRVRLGPGHLKKSYLTFKRTIGLNSLFYYLRSYIVQGTAASKATYTVNVRLGRTRFFQFEKLCDTRGTGHQDIALAWIVTGKQ